MSVVFFAFWWTIFGEGCQNCKLCFQKSFFKRWLASEKIKCLQFLSLIVEFSDFWQKKLHGFKNCISRVHKISLRKKCFNKKLNTWFFWTFNGKLFKVPWSFFRPSVKMQSRPPSEILEEYMKFEINFDSLCYKFLAWVSFLFSTCPGEPFEEKIASINYFSPTFFRAGNFSGFLGSFFRQGCQTCNLCDWRRFLMKCFLKKTGCLHNYFQKLSGRLLNFCPVFWQRC